MALTGYPVERADPVAPAKPALERNWELT